VQGCAIAPGNCLQVAGGARCTFMDLVRPLCLPLSSRQSSFRRARVASWRQQAHRPKCWWTTTWNLRWTAVVAPCATTLRYIFASRTQHRGAQRLQILCALSRVEWLQSGVDQVVGRPTRQRSQNLHQRPGSRDTREPELAAHTSTRTEKVYKRQILTCAAHLRCMMPPCVRTLHRVRNPEE
jgi:hypothetical protein